MLALDPRICDAIEPYLGEHFGNASSVTHVFGVEARDAVERARRSVAALIGAADERGVVFTSGAAESNRLAIGGRLQASPDPLILDPRIAPTAEDGIGTLAGGRITRLRIERGSLDLNELAGSLETPAAMLSVCGADVTTGALAPLAEIAARAADRATPVHCDATWLLGRGALDVERDGLGFVTVDGAALGSPAGVGALWIRRCSLLGVRSDSDLQSALVPGTLNVPAIVALGVAADLARAERGTRQDLAAPLLEALAPLGAAALLPPGAASLWGHVSVELPALAESDVEWLREQTPPHRRVAIMLAGGANAALWIARHATPPDVERWAQWLVAALSGR